MIHFFKSVYMKTQTHLHLRCPEGQSIFSTFSFLGELYSLMTYTIFGNTFHITLIYTVIRAHITLLLLQKTYQPVFWTEVPSSACAGSPDLHHRWTTAESWEIQIQTPPPHEQTPARSHMAPLSGHHLLSADSTETQSPVLTQHACWTCINHADSSADTHKHYTS